MEDKKKKANYLIIALCAGIGAAVPAILNNTVFSPSTKINKELMQVASQINAACPIMVDHMTRLDNAISTPDKRFIYSYTLMTEIPDDIDKDAFVGELKPTLVNKFKNLPEVQPMFEQGITVVCRYKRLDGTHIADISITPKDIGK
jgi:hypothetical protein